MAEKKRPTSVAVIAWIITITSGLSLVATPFTVMMPLARQAIEATGMSVGMAIFWGMLSGAIGVVSGIAMLKGVNWGRLLYLWAMPIMTVLNWILYGFNANGIPGIIVYVIFLIFLIRPAASAFFGSEEVAEEAAVESEAGE